MKKFKRLFILLGLGLLTIFALLKLGNIEISFNTLARVNWLWFCTAFCILYGTVLLRGLRWQRILRTIGWPVNFVYAQTLLMAGLFLSSILPARLGDVGRVLMLKQDHRVPVAHSVASIATERALDIFSILTLTIIGALWVLSNRIPTEVWQLIIGTSALFGFGLVGLVAVPSLESWLRNPFPGWRQHLNRRTDASPKHLKYRLWRLYQKLLNFGFSLIHGVRDLGKSPLMLAIVLIESLLIWLGDGLVIHFALLSISRTTSLGVSLFSGMVADLAAAVPLTPGAIGQFDVALVGLLTLFDISTADSSLTTILVRLISLWTLIPITGAVTYIFGFSRMLNLNRPAVEVDTNPATPVLTSVEG